MNEDELKRRVYAHAQQPANVQQLAEAVIEECDSISQQFISHLMCSMRRCFLALMIANGG